MDPRRFLCCLAVISSPYIDFCCWTAVGAQKQHLVEIWAQLEAARGEAEEQKRQLATAQVSVSARSVQHAAIGMGPHCYRPLS